MSFQSHVELITRKMIDLESLWKITGLVPIRSRKRPSRNTGWAALDHRRTRLRQDLHPGRAHRLPDHREGPQPENLLVVTFTDKAAQELTTRISNRLIELDVRFNLNEMYLGTFHSICLRWLDDYREFTRLKRNFTMMDQFDQQYFLYQRLRDYDDIPGIEHIVGPPNASAWDKSKQAARWLNTVSEEALDPDAPRRRPTTRSASSARPTISTSASSTKRTPSTSPPSSTRPSSSCAATPRSWTNCASRSPTSWSTSTRTPTPSRS